MKIDVPEGVTVEHVKKGGPNQWEARHGEIVITGLTKAAVIEAMLEVFEFPAPAPAPVISAEAEKVVADTVPELSSNGGGNKKAPKSKDEGAAYGILRGLLKSGDAIDFAAVAERLNKEGHTTATGKPWTAGNTRSVCTDKRRSDYIGGDTPPTAKRERSARTKARKGGDGDESASEDHHPVREIHYVPPKPLEWDMNKCKKHDIALVLQTRPNRAYVCPRCEER